MWQVIYIASSSGEAGNIKKFLEKEGFLIKIEPVTKDEYQLKALASEAEDVYKFLNDYHN